MALKFDKVKVLVIDDNEPMRKLVVSVLEALGIGRVMQAPSAERAWDILAAERPDIILTDWHMEKMNGIEFTEKVRTDPASPDRLIPIILITGYSSRQRVSEARDKGVTEFLVKPFRADDVAKRIAHVVNHPRDFIDAPGFFGPDRRRRKDEAYAGPRRRATDAQDSGKKDEQWFVG